MKQTVRIIAGTWRSRKLRFPEAEGLRPSPDRVRETVFNWLRDDVEGASCLDLYAGSGALGFEAASRGARRVVMVESNPQVIAGLKANCQKLEAGESVEIHHAPALAYLRGPPEQFDLVFLDPPFQKGWLESSAEALVTRGWLTSGAFLYMEAEKTYDFAAIPKVLRLYRQGCAGDVAFRIYQNNGACI